jgi:putative ABC transport system permease protein
MIGYYFDLALRSLRRNKGLTVLMILAIAFGVGASMTTMTVLHILSKDPIPAKSDKLFYVQLDPYEAKNYKPNEEPAEQSTRLDAVNLLRAKKADRQVMMTGGNAAIDAQRPGLLPFVMDTRWTSSEFFAMFGVKFIAGGGWTEQDDASHARVTVISRELAEKVFGSTAVVGRTLKVESYDFRVVGVVEDFRVVPHFYDLNTDVFGKGESLWAPIETALELDLGRSGSMNCWGETTEKPESLGAPCEWIQVWVELDSLAKWSAYRDFLIAYSEQQKAAGKFERPPNVRLRSVMEWLAYNKVVPKDVKLQLWIALGFLAVCLINTIGLLLTKFLRRSSEIGVRRALGASKRSIFVQLLVEAGVIGLAGGVLGLGLAYLGLWAVRHQPTQYADLAHLDMPMLGLTFGLAFVTSVLAGLLPAWRGCQVAPALQLKSL